MKNRSKPFFYDKKRPSFIKIMLIFLLSALLLIFSAYQIPGIRQVIAEPLYSLGSLTWNAIREFISMTRMYHEPEEPVKTYPVIEFPDKDVLFAESLENLSALNQEDPLADLRQTPTPSEYARVAEWEYLDPNLNYSVRTGEQPPETITTVNLIPPVFEHADLYNDGAAILSAAMRFWGIVENQYHIAQRIHPDAIDPYISFSDMESYISDMYKNFSSIVRINGDRDLLIGLLYRKIPVLLFIQHRSPLTFWPSDDHLDGRYIMVLGYNSTEKSFSYQDTFRGNTMEISENELLALWYPFQREYMVIYPTEMDDDIRDVLSENYFEELNIQRSLVKFRTDSELLPENPYAQYNCGTALYFYGDYNGAWEQFNKARKLTLPQRFIHYRYDILDTALRLGYADDIMNMTKDQYKRNAHDEILTLYRGWASILRGDIQVGTELFKNAEKINPGNELVIYALKYRETMIN